MSELESLRYSNLRSDISKHIDKMAALVELLRAMDTTLDETLVIGILVASIDVTQLQPVTAAIKTLSEDKLSWEDVSGRLI